MRRRSTSSGGPAVGATAAGGPRRGGGVGAGSRADIVDKLQGWAAALKGVAQGQGTGDQKAALLGAAAPDVLRHADGEVRLWAATCLAEGLRIFAPDPPLSMRQRRSALDLFIEQVRSLGAPQSLNGGPERFQLGLGLLEELTEVRAFMLLFECEGHEEDLIVSLVSACLAAVRGDEGGVLESPLARLLADVLGECDDIPEAALRTLIDELTTAPRRRERGGQYRPVDLVRRVLGSLAHRNAALPINEFINRSLYFEGPARQPQASAAGAGAVVASSSASAPPGQLDEEEERTEASMATTERRDSLFRAVHELFVIDPQLVSRVFPHLHADLLSKDAGRRRTATTLVGKLLSHAPAAGQAGAAAQEPLVERYPLLLDRHLERVEDADEGVRLAAWDGAKDLLLTAAACQTALAAATVDGSAGSAGGAEDLGRRDAMASTCDQALLAAAERVQKRLTERSLDPSEDVRLKVVVVASEVALASRSGLVLLAPVLPEVLSRILDKRHRVRDAAAEAIAKLYAAYALPEIVAERAENAEALRWAPRLLCEAFQVLAQGRLGHTARCEELIEQHVLGCGAKDASAEHRARALAALCGAALGDSAASLGLAALLARKREAHSALRRYLALRLSRGAPLLADASAPAAHRAEAPAAGLKQLASGEAADDEAAAAAASASAAASAAMRDLARASPVSEDKTLRPEAVLARLRALDGVRDRALWSHLERLTRPALAERTEDMPTLLAELDRLLRTHRLTDLGPLVRRSLLCTWLLPEQVASLLHQWAAGTDHPDDHHSSAASALGRGVGTRRRRRSGTGAAQRLAAEAGGTEDDPQRSVALLAKFFPGAFFSHSVELATRLRTSGSDAGVAAAPAALDSAARVALRALASVGKSAVASERSGGADASSAASRPALAAAPGGGGVLDAPGVPSELDPETLAAGLLEVVGSPSAADSPVARAALCRRALRCLGALPPSRAEAGGQPPREVAVDRLLRWVSAQCAEAVGEGGGPPPMALHLAAACVEAAAEGLVVGGLAFDEDRWSTLAAEAARRCAGLGASPPSDPEALCASIDLCLAVADAGQLLGQGAGLLARAGAHSADAELQAVAITLRPLRRGLIPLSTELLSSLATRLCGAAAVSAGSSAGELDVVVDALQRWQKPAAIAQQARLFDRLRLTAALPTALALSPTKRHREAAQRLVHSALARAARQQHQPGSQEPMLDVATACFLHFLSRLEPFEREASAAASAYPRSSKISELFCEALLKSDPSRKPTELGVVALRVCDRARFFEDCERPGSNAVHKAASVLRHVVEKHCPDLGKKVPGLLLTGATRGAMPAELFALRQERPAADAAAIEGGAATSPGKEAPIAAALTATAGASPLPLPAPPAAVAAAGPVSADGGGGVVASVARPMARTSALFGGIGGSGLKRPAAKPPAAVLAAASAATGEKRLRTG